MEISTTPNNTYLGLPRLDPEGREGVRLGQPLPLGVGVAEAWVGVEAGEGGGRRSYHVDSVTPAADTEDLDPVPEVLVVVERVVRLSEGHPGRSPLRRAGRPGVLQGEEW